MIYISIPSALDYWLSGTNRGDLKKPYKILDFQPDSCEKPAGNAHLPDLPYPITIMLAKRAARYRNEYYNYTSVHSVFPEKCFVYIGNGICVASPELCFLLSARYLSLAQMVELGNNLCAAYVSDNNRPYGQRTREPVTCAANIMRFLAGINGCHGISKSLMAASYIKDNSGSPMESKCGAMFFLPKCHGGFGVKGNGCFNGLINLSDVASRLLGTRTCRGDILWETDRTVFEYDSSLTHNDTRQREIDARRQSAMNQSGYKVVRFTADTIRSFDNFEDATLALMADLGMRNTRPALEKYKHKRRIVFNELFARQNNLFTRQSEPLVRYEEPFLHKNPR